MGFKTWGLTAGESTDCGSKVKTAEDLRGVVENRGEDGVSDRWGD